MGIRLFSDRNRGVHMGPFPTERLARLGHLPDLSAVPPLVPVGFHRPEAPESIVNAMGEYQAMMDAIRDGLVNRARAEIPADPRERADHIKAFGYFNDAAMVGICKLPAAAHLAVPVVNPDITRLAQDLRTRQTKTLASGIDVIMADLKDSMEAPPSTIQGHTHAVVFLYENPRPRGRASLDATGSATRWRSGAACARPRRPWCWPITSACWGLTPRPIAERLRMSVSTVSRWRRGWPTWPAIR
ncbi:helix-turn-helix domain-containing protein [Seohaeicola zhoushanensis]